MQAGATTGRTESQAELRVSLRQAARILEVPEARLRALARAGFLAPQRGPLGPLSFGFQDLVLLRTTKELLESGVSMRQIRRVWASLREQLTSERPLTGITIEAEGDDVVATDGSTRWEADSGQLLLDFEPDAIATHVDEVARFVPRLVAAPAP